MLEPSVPKKTIPWWELTVGEREKKLVCEVIDTQFINDGDYTTLLEHRIAEICEVPHAVAVTSGTMAIFTGLAALGIGSGDEVIVPDVTFIATANAVSLTGAKPVFVDVLLEDFNVDPEAVERAITKRTKAILPVHVSGRGADMDALVDIAKRHKLYIVEDAAEALGSRYQGKPLGSFGEFGCFSFSSNKTITTGQGGMVVTRDAALYNRLRELKDQGRPQRGTGGADEHISLGYNFKLTNIQAAVGLAQLETFAVRCEHQQWLYNAYREHLRHVPGIRLPEFDIPGGEIPQWVDAFVEDRDRLHDFLLGHGIHTRKYWFPIHTQTPYRLTDSLFPISQEVSQKGLWLPSALSLNEDDIRTVCDHIIQWAEHTSFSKC